jgi:hypothetical protein
MFSRSQQVACRGRFSRCPALSCAADPAETPTCYAERKEQRDAAQEIQPAPLQEGPFVRCAPQATKGVSQKEEADGDIDPEQCLFVNEVLGCAA